MEQEKALTHEILHGGEAKVLSDDQWSEIRLFLKSGKPIKQIAREFGISKNTVRRILRDCLEG